MPKIEPVRIDEVVAAAEPADDSAGLGIGQPGRDVEIVVVEGDPNRRLLRRGLAVEGSGWVKPPKPAVFQTLSERTPSIVIGSAAGTAAIVRTVRGSAALSWETALSETTGAFPAARRADDGTGKNTKRRKRREDERDGRNV